MTEACTARRAGRSAADLATRLNAGKLRPRAGPAVDLPAHRKSKITTAFEMLLRSVRNAEFVFLNRDLAIEVAIFGNSVRN